MTRIVWNTSQGPIRVRIPLHNRGVSMKALRRSADRASRRARRFAGVYQQNGPALRVVASQRQRRHR